MDIEEIFSLLATHMKTGVEMHYKMMEACNFLSLIGYKKCQEYHYFSELQGQLKLCNYYMEHYHKLLNLTDIKPIEIFSQSWYKYTQQDVDTNTKRTAIRDIIKKWIKWEQETKALYQNMYKELVAISEIAAAKFIESYIEDVSKELLQVEQKQIELETIDYNLIEILKEQTYYVEKYKKKIKRA